MTDENNSNKKQDNDDSNSYIGYGVAFGLLGGALLSNFVGIFFKSPLIWGFGPGFGMIIGIVIGAIMDLNKKEE